MFAGSGTGGIPGSGTDRSATGPATGQVTAVLDAERAGEARTELGWGVRAGADAGVCEAGRKSSTPTATAATDTPQNHTRRLARLRPANLAHADPPCTVPGPLPGLPVVIPVPGQ